MHSYTQLTFTSSPAMTVDQNLRSKVDLRVGILSHDGDPVTKGRCDTKCPTTPTICGQYITTIKIVLYFCRTHQHGDNIYCIKHLHCGTCWFLVAVR